MDYSSEIANLHQNLRNFNITDEHIRLYQHRVELGELYEDKVRALQRRIFGVLPYNIWDIANYTKSTHALLDDCIFDDGQPINQAITDIFILGLYEIARGRCFDDLALPVMAVALNTVIIAGDENQHLIYEPIGGLSLKRGQLMCAYMVMCLHGKNTVFCIWIGKDAKGTWIFSPSGNVLGRVIDGEYHIFDKPATIWPFKLRKRV